MSGAVNGATLRQLRLNAGMSQVEIARRARLSKAALSRIEGGERGIDIDEYIRIMAALRLNPGDYLVNSGRVPTDLMPHLDALIAMPTPYRATALRVILALADLARER